MVVSNVASLVCSARITSTSTITGTGFIKCIPTKRSGRFVSAASVVTEIDDVLLAMMTSGGRISSASPSTGRLISIFSGTASTTKSAAAMAVISVTGCNRPRTVSFSASAILPFLISRSRFFLIVSIPRSRNRCSTSRKITLYPERANTCAMPFPIVPAPSTATVLTSAMFKKPPPKNTRGNGNTGHAETSSGGELFPLPGDVFRRNCQGQPRGQGGELFILRPRSAKSSAKLGNSAHQISALEAENLPGAVQEFSLLDFEILEAATNARVEKRLSEKLTIRRMNQRVRRKNPVQRRERSS